jgi:hypothetical protein
MMMLYHLAYDLHFKLVQLPPKSLAKITFYRWIMWWNKVIPGSTIWKSMIGELPPNINNQFLPEFLIDHFSRNHFGLMAGMLAMLKYLSPMAVPADYPLFDYAIRRDKDFAQRMLLYNCQILSYFNRSD